MELAVGAGGGDVAAIGGETRIDPAASRKFRDAQRGAFDEVEFAGERDEEARAVFGELVSGEALERLAGALATGFFLNSWWGLVGILPILTAIVRFCPAYLPLGINTCGTDTEKKD